MIARFTQSFAHFRLDRAFASSLLDTGKYELIDRRITCTIRSACGICNCRLLHYNLARLFSCRHIHLRRRDSTLLHIVRRNRYTRVHHNRILSRIQVARRPTTKPADNRENRKQSLKKQRDQIFFCAVTADDVNDDDLKSPVTESVIREIALKKFFF